MKFTILALFGAASAINLHAEPNPLTQNTAAAISDKGVNTYHVGTTGGHDSKTLQSKTPSPTSAQEFKSRDPAAPDYADKYHGFQVGESFQLTTAMDGNKVIYATRSPISLTFPHAVGKYNVTFHSKQFEVHLREAEGSTAEYWYWDEKNKLVRNISNGEHCLTWDHEAPLANGSLVVVGPCPDGPSNYGLYYTKETYTIQPDADKKLCLATQKSTNNEEAKLVFATCSASDKSQNFYPYYRYQTQGPHWNRLQNE